MNKTTRGGRGHVPVVVVLGMVLALLLVFEPEAASQSCGGGSSVGPTTAAGIPQSLMPFYDGAAGKYQLGPDGWAYLAAINNVETDFGQNISTSSAGAVGWMQFEPGTWATYGVTPSGAKAPMGPRGGTTLATRSTRPPTTCRRPGRRAIGPARSSRITTRAGT